MILKNVTDEGQGAVLPVLWIGGILERATGQVKLYCLPDRRAVSIIPPILETVPVGSIIAVMNWLCTTGCIILCPTMPTSVSITVMVNMKEMKNGMRER